MMVENGGSFIFFFFFAFYSKVSPSVSSDINPVNLTVYERKRQKPILDSAFLSRTSSPSVLVDFTYV